MTPAWLYWLVLAAVLVGVVVFLGTLAHRARRDRTARGEDHDDG